MEKLSRLLYPVDQGEERVAKEGKGAMENLLMGIAFVYIVIAAVLIRFIIPSVLVVVGTIRMRSDKRNGGFVLAVGIIYLIVSMALYVYSYEKYGI